MIADVQAVIANVNAPKGKKFRTRQFLRDWKGREKQTPEQIAETMKAQARSYGAVSVQDMINSGKPPPS